MPEGIVADIDNASKSQLKLIGLHGVGGVCVGVWVGGYVEVTQPGVGCRRGTVFMNLMRGSAPGAVYSSLCEGSANNFDYRGVHSENCYF